MAMELPSGEPLSVIFLDTEGFYIVLSVVCVCVCMRVVCACVCVCVCATRIYASKRVCMHEHLDLPSFREMWFIGNVHACVVCVY